MKGKEKRLREIEGTLGKGNKEKEKWVKGKEEGGITRRAFKLETCRGHLINIMSCKKRGEHD